MGGTPKPSILIYFSEGFPLINHPAIGVASITLTPKVKCDVPGSSEGCPWAMGGCFRMGLRRNLPFYGDFLGFHHSEPSKTWV